MYLSAILPKSLIYLWYAVRYPNLKDFVDMGLGIEARHSRCRKEWARHLRATQDFQGEVLSSVSRDLGRPLTTVILGAGRLLDVNLDALDAFSKEVLCVDADPSAKNFALSKLGSLKKVSRISYEVQEITHSLSEWSEALNKIRSEGEASAFLLSVRAESQKEAPWQGDVMCSLNLLSQIPLYWRDRVVEFVEKKLDIHPHDLGDFKEPLQSALKGSMRELQRSHLELLNRSGARSILLITDTQFEYYREGETFLIEPALYVSVLDELSFYSEVRSQEWTWEIAPQGIEQKEFGVRHRVRALELLKKG